MTEITKGKTEFRCENCGNRYGLQMSTIDMKGSRFIQYRIINLEEMYRHLEQTPEERVIEWNEKQEGV